MEKAPKNSAENPEGGKVNRREFLRLLRDVGVGAAVGTSAILGGNELRKHLSKRQIEIEDLKILISGYKERLAKPLNTEGPEDMFTKNNKIEMLSVKDKLAEAEKRLQKLEAEEDKSN